MLKNTFCHLPGIGVSSEKRVWASGVLSWDDFFQATPGTLPFGRKKAETVRENIQQSLSCLDRREAGYFADSMPAGQSWRLFPEFRDSIAYLDIETTGMGGSGDYITAIALYDGRSISYYVHGRNMSAFSEDIQRYKVVVTYNGKCFDLPFIRGHLGVDMNQAHIDLRYVLKSLGYGGGLKGCEKKLGIERNELDGVDGYFAVLLWQEYKRKKNERALETLLAYNIADTVNLEALLVLAYNMNLRETPFAGTHTLPLPEAPEIPFTADQHLIERIKQEMTVYY